MHACMHASARPNITHGLSVYCAAPSSSLLVLLIPFLPVLESWSDFIFHRNLCVPEMEQEQTPKQVHPEDTETVQTEEQDAKREINTMNVFHATIPCMYR